MRADTTPCRLCSADARLVGRRRILDAHDIGYFLCAACDLLQTEQPYWLADAYAKAMTALDTGAVQRNQTCVRLTAMIASLAGVSPTAPCLDFGGGHGVFTRMMRDAGFDFRWFDKYAENLYASGFEGDVAAHHALVTSFEVFEHLDGARDELARVFAPNPDHVLVGTVLHHGFDPSWWYLMGESGQHIAFYSPRTLAWIADRFGYDVLVGPTYSLFRKRDLGLGWVRRRAIAQVLRHPTAALDVVGLVPELLRRKLWRHTRVDADHEALLARSRS
jgi:hypothetical protein